MPKHRSGERRVKQPMVKTLIRIAFITLLLGAQAFTQRVIPYPLPVGASLERAFAAKTRTRNGDPGQRAFSNYASYEIRAEVDPASATVNGNILMKYENRSRRIIRNLHVHLRQNLHKEGGLRKIPVAITGGMVVGGVTLRKGAKRPERADYSIDDTRMVINLRRYALKPGDKVTVSMKFSFRVPPAGEAPRMGHEDNRVFFLAYWYPQFAVYDDVHQWVADPYLGAGEFYMGYADYDLEITLPHGYLVQATGALSNPKDVLTSTAISRLASAAVSRETQKIVTAKELGPGRATRKSSSGKLTWMFRAKNVRDCAVSFSDRYVWDATHAVVKNQRGPGQDGLSMIHALYEPRAPYWPYAAEFCRHAIEFTSREVMPYPWPKMGVCEGIIGGGMEFPMMTLIGTYPTKAGFYEVVAHETIHMWWPMIVGTNEKRHSWMDEGITSFMEGRARDDFFNTNRAFRSAVQEYVGVARIGSEVESMRGTDNYPSWLPGAYGFATYSKPSAVLHQLRHQLGPAVFDECLRSYTRNWAYRHPLPQDLFSTFKTVSSIDTDPYFRMWMYETWTLDRRIAEVRPSANGTEVTIEDRGLAFGPLTVEATLSDGSKQRQLIPESVWLSGAKSHTLRFPPTASAIRLDPDKVTLELRRDDDSWSR